MPSPAAACILVRHAHAEWPAWRGRDFDRPLTPRGLEDARATGRAIRAAGHSPSLMVASSARRTAQTAGILMEELGMADEDLQLLDPLYNADAGVLLAALRAAHAEGTVVLVAHNPGVSELARLLSGAEVSPAFRPADWRGFPRAAITAVENTAMGR